MNYLINNHYCIIATVLITNSARSRRQASQLSQNKFTNNSGGLKLSQENAVLRTQPERGNSHRFYSALIRITQQKRFYFSLFKKTVRYNFVY